MSSRTALVTRLLEKQLAAARAGDEEWAFPFSCTIGGLHNLRAFIMLLILPPIGMVAKVPPPCESKRLMMGQSSRHVNVREWKSRWTWVVIVAFSMTLGACSKALPPMSQIPCPPPPAIATTFVRAPPALSIPSEDLGWYQSERCTHDWVAEKKPIWFRLARDHVDMLAEDYAERFDTELTVTKQDEWNVFSGKYEVGKAIWMVDGFVILQGPLVSPRMRQKYADQKDLKTIYRRITFTEQPEGMVVSLIPANNTGDHSRFGWLECQMFKLPDDHHARYDALFERETGPVPCVEAMACCQAIKAAGRGAGDEDTVDVCNGHPDLTARYCRSWIARAVDQFRWGYESTCTTERNGQRFCSIGERPKKPRVVPAACISAEKTDAPANAVEP